MNEFTFEERNLMCLYSAYGTRSDLIASLTEMRSYLEPDETELWELTNNALAKLRRMTDAEFEAVDLYSDFDLEDSAYGE